MVWHVRPTCIRTPELTGTSCVTLGKFLSLSKLRFHYLETRHDDNMPRVAADVIERDNTKCLSLPVPLCSSVVAIIAK